MRDINNKTIIHRILYVFACILLLLSVLNIRNIVHAEDTGTITINTPVLPDGVKDTNTDPFTTPSYTVYKVFDGNGNGTSIRYTLPEERSTTDEAWTSSHMDTYFEVDAGGNVKIRDGAYTTTDGKQYLKEDAVKAVGAYVVAANLTGTKTSYDETSKSYKLSGLSDGYYYITTTTGSVVMINTRNGQENVAIQDKNTLPTVDKKQTTETDNDGKPVDSSYTDKDVNVATGDTIYYEAIVNVPFGINDDVVLSDHLSVAFIPNFEPVAKGSDQDANTLIKDGGITVEYKDSDNIWKTLDKGEDNNPNYIITANWTADDKTRIHGFTVHIKPTDATKGKTLRFLYSATVGGGFMEDNGQDKDASDKLIDQKRNKIELKYKTYTQEDKVFFHTNCAGAIKYDTSTGDVDETTNVLTAKAGKTLKYLPDAKFKLQERLKGSNTDWSDTPVVCNGQREFYRPAVLDAEKTKEEGKWVGTDGDDVLDYNSDNGFIQPCSGEYKHTDKDQGNEEQRGWIVLRGLDPDKDYRLVEVGTLDGYNAPVNPYYDLIQTPDTRWVVRLTKNSTDPQPDNTEYLKEKTILKIGNTPGTVLPSTGGTGITIFYITGGIVITIALLLMMNRREWN